MLEEIVRAIESARISFLLKQLRNEQEWGAARTPEEDWRMQTPFPAQVTSNSLRAEIFPARDEPAFMSYGRFVGETVAVTYISAHEEQTVTYVIGNHYAKRAGYRSTRLDAFYVHVPPWASINLATQQDLGRGVLGTANTRTGEIRLLHTLDPAERTEVLLHETLHLMYPLHSEKQIRDLTRTIMGAQYCRFH